MRLVLACLFVILLPALVFAEPAPTTGVKMTVAGTVVPASAPVEAKPVVEQVTGVYKLFKNKEWRPAFAALLTLLIFFWRRFDSKLIGKLPAKHLAWITALVGMLGALVPHLLAPTWSWGDFVLDGLLLGSTAALFWSTLGKLVLPKIFGEPLSK